MSVDPPRAARGARPPARCSTLQAGGRPGLRAPRRRGVRRAAGARHPRARPRTGCRRSRRHVEFGASPRATLGLVAAARALALLRGRDYVLPADVADVAVDVLAHRLVLTFDAVADGIDPRQIVDYLVAVVPQPQIAPHDEPREPARATVRSGMRSLAESRARLRRARPRPCAAARGPAARRAPRAAARAGQRAGRGGALPARRGRRPPHRLERHRPDRRTARLAHPGRPRARHLGAGRRDPQHGLRHRRGGEARPRRLGRPARSACSPTGPATGWACPPARRRVRLVAARSRRGGRPSGRCCRARRRALPPRGAAGRRVGLAEAIAAARTHGTAGPGCGSSSPTSSSPTAPWSARSPGRRRCAGWPPATRCSPSRSSTRASSSCPDVGPVVLVDPETGHRREVSTSIPRLREQYAALAAHHAPPWPQAVRASGAEHLSCAPTATGCVDLARFVARPAPAAARRPTPGVPR